MKKSKLIVTILGVVFLIGGLATGLYLVGQRQILTKKAAPASTIKISPVTQSKSPGDNFTFSVDLDTGENTVTVVDLKITFNPSVIQITSLQKGAGATGLDKELNNLFDNQAGTISYAIYTTDTATGLHGSSIEVLKVNATVKADAVAGSYNIVFDPTSEAAASGEGQNVLVDSIDGVLTVAAAGGSPTTSPTASPTASPGGTASPTATPTVTATPTLTPTPTLSTGGTGSSSSVKITSPTNNSSVSDSTPTIKGTAPAGSTVTITIYSTPITATVTADANGNWQYTPSQTLADGSHTVTVGSGSSTVNSSFTVTTGSATLPVTGVDWPTFLGIGLGVVVIIASFLIAL